MLKFAQRPWADTTQTTNKRLDTTNDAITCPGPSLHLEVWSHRAPQIKKFYYKGWHRQYNMYIQCKTYKCNLQGHHCMLPWTDHAWENGALTHPHIRQNPGKMYCMWEWRCYLLCVYHSLSVGYIKHNNIFDGLCRSFLFLFHMTYLVRVQYTRDIHFLLEGCLLEVAWCGHEDC